MELQESIEVVTPITKKKVVLRGYVTGRIKQAIERVYLSDSEMTAGSGEDDDAPSLHVNAATSIDARNKAIELLVISVDGKTEDVLESVLDLPEADYDFIRSEVDKIENPLVPSTQSPSETITDASSTPDTSDPSSQPTE